MSDKKTLKGNLIFHCIYFVVCAALCVMFDTYEIHHEVP